MLFLGELCSRATAAVVHDPHTILCTRSRFFGINAAAAGEFRRRWCQGLLASVLQALARPRARRQVVGDGVNVPYCAGVCRGGPSTAEVC